DAARARRPLQIDFPLVRRERARDIFSAAFRCQTNLPMRREFLSISPVGSHRWFQNRADVRCSSKSDCVHAPTVLRRKCRREAISSSSADSDRNGQAKSEAWRAYQAQANARLRIEPEFPKILLSRAMKV